jgi:hypothetical protein
MIKKRTIKQQVSDDDDIKNEPEAYRPYTATNIKIKRTKYSTSLDPRGYIPGNFNISNAVMLLKKFYFI